MTVEQIQQRQQREARKFELAAQIRKLLDNESEEHEDEDWPEIEAEILALVSEDE